MALEMVTEKVSELKRAFGMPSGRKFIVHMCSKGIYDIWLATLLFRLQFCSRQM